MKPPANKQEVFDFMPKTKDKRIGKRQIFMRETCNGGYDAGRSGCQSGTVKESP
jgi:hypothetical protein